MNDMSQPAGVGHNNPPLSETLGDKYREMVATAAELLAAAEKAPATVFDDKTAEDIADLVKKLQTNENDLKNAQAAERAPFDLAISQIGGFFKRWLDKVEPVKKSLKARNADYKAKKDAAAKKKAEEEAAAKRAEEERMRREANDAKTTADAARAALEDFKRLEDEAKAARESALTEQEKAAAEVAKCEANLAKVKADNAAIAAQLAQRVIDKNPADEAEKAEKRAECTKNLETAKADLQAAKELLAEARDRAKAAREAQRKAEEEAATKKQEAERAARDEKSATKEADRVGQQAAKIENKLEAGEVSAGGIRSIHGALQTSQRVWKCQVIDRNLLDKEALWNLIHGDAIDVALRKWMLNQTPENRKMDGAQFWEEDQAVIR